MRRTIDSKTHNINTKKWNRKKSKQQNNNQFLFSFWFGLFGLQLRNRKQYSTRYYETASNNRLRTDQTKCLRLDIYRFDSWIWIISLRTFVSLDRIRWWVCHTMIDQMLQNIVIMLIAKRFWYFWLLSDAKSTNNIRQLNEINFIIKLSKYSHIRYLNFPTPVVRSVDCYSVSYFQWSRHLIENINKVFTLLCCGKIHAKNTFLLLKITS